MNPSTKSILTMTMTLPTIFPPLATLTILLDRLLIQTSYIYNNVRTPRLAHSRTSPLTLTLDLTAYNHKLTPRLFWHSSALPYLLLQFARPLAPFIIATAITYFGVSKLQDMAVNSTSPVVSRWSGRIKGR
jgi:hypothetical protein